jgi:hypothetical protein
MRLTPLTRTGLLTGLDDAAADDVNFVPPA